MNRLFAAASLGAVLLVQHFAVAVPLQLNPTYKAKYSDGVKKQNAGDFGVALATFESIPVEERSYDTRLHIATCKARLGRLLDAAAELEQIIAVAKTDKLPATQREAIIDTAKSDLDELLLETPHLSVAVSARTTNVSVTIDGTAVTPPVDQPVDPGAHLVVAKRDGKEVFRKEITLERRAKTSVDVDVAPPVAPSVEPTKPVAPPATETPSKPISGYVALGAGVAFGAIAVGGFIARGTAYDDFKASCDTAAGCDDGLRAPVRKWEAISFTSAGLAVVGVGVGIYLLAKPRSPSVALNLGPASVQLVGSF